MGKSGQIRLREMRRIVTLTHECRDLGDDAHVWHRHFMAGVAGVVGADLVIGGELADLPSGRPRSIGESSWGWHHGFDRRGWQEALASLHHDPGYATEILSYGRRLRDEDGPALTGTDLVEARLRVRTPDYALYQVMGVEHVVWCCRRLEGDSNETFGGIFCRETGRRDFGGREKAVVAEAHALVASLAGTALARYAEPSPAALPPRPREVLRCVLEGDGDKQIASRLGISPHTVNQYLKTIFDHFGVSGRAELLARWVRRGWGGPAPGWGEAEAT